MKLTAPEVQDLRKQLRRVMEDPEEKAELGHDVLDRLVKTKMSVELLNSTGIGKTVHRLTKQRVKKSLARRAAALECLWRMQTFYEYDDVRSKFLKNYRKRVRFWESKKQAKGDMKAYSEVRALIPNHTRVHGLIPGVPVGLRVQGRGAAAILGLHMTMLAGIDARRDEACYAVCLAGKYANALDPLTGIIAYTGRGGDHGQTTQRKDYANASLITSHHTGRPLRVLRKINTTGKQQNLGMEYEYLGLYKCTQYTYEKEEETNGARIYRFTLVPQGGNQSLHSIRRNLRRPAANAGGAKCQR